MTSSETAQVVYHNDLIMSEVYRYLDRSDLSQCLLVTKAGYYTAAKAFFHTSSHESFTKMTAKGCSFASLASWVLSLQGIDADRMLQSFLHQNRID